MGAPPLTSVLTYGQENKKSPEDIADAVQKWRRDVLEEGRLLAKNDPERYWKGSTEAEAAAQTVLTGLNEVRRQKLLTEKIPIPAEQKLFIDTLNANKGELPAEAPAVWKETEAALVALGEDPKFQGAKGFQGKVAQGTNDLGTYEVRQTPDGDFEALVQPTGEQKPIIKRFRANRQEMQDEADAELRRIQEQERQVAQRTADIDYANDPEGRKNYMAQFDQAVEATLKPERARQTFVDTASVPALVHDRIVNALRSDEDFLATVPQNRLEQFTERPARNIYATLQNAATGIGDLVSGTTSSGKAAAGRAAYIDEQAPGTLRSRFETGDHTFYDFASQGLESLATLYGPGAVVKGARLATLGTRATEAVAAAGLRSAIAAEGVGTVGQQFRLGALNYLSNPATSEALGWGALFTSAYGANYGAALQEADSLEATDPVRAARIRSMAQFSSLANATLEILSEKAVGPQEAMVFRGRRFGLLEAAMIPASEGVEEVVGTVAQNTLGGLTNTGRSPESVETAAVGGLVGGTPFAGLAALTSRNGRVAVADSPINSEVGGAVLGRVPVDTPIEQIEEITDNLTEGERRRRELEAVDSGAPIAEAPAAGPVSSSEEIVPLVPSETPASESITSGDSSNLPTPQEQLSNEPAPGGESGVVEPVSTEDPLVTDLQPDETVEPEVQPVPILPSRQLFPARYQSANLQVAQAPNTRLAKFANEVAGFSDSEVVWFSGNEQAPDGFQLGNRLYLNVNSRQALRKVAGHELWHRVEDSPAAERLLEVLRERNPEAWQTYQAQLQSADVRPEHVDSEFAADVFGEAIADRAFWRSVRQSTPANVFQKLVDSVLTAIDKIVGAWKGTNQLRLASPSVRNLETAREAIREVLRSEAGEATVRLREGVSETRATAKFIGTQKGIDEDLDLYNLVDPGNPSDGTTFSVPAGASQEEVQERVEGLAGVRESRLGPTQEKGVKIGMHEVVAQESLHRVVDSILDPSKVRVDSFDEVLRVFTSLRRANGEVKNRIRQGVAKEFSTRIASFPAKGGKRAKEIETLEAQAVQVLLANAAAIGAEFSTRQGKQNQKRAAIIANELSEIAFENIQSVSADAHTAARVLRSSQLEGGDLAALMHDLFAARTEYMEQKAKGTREAVKETEEAMRQARPEAKRRAALAASREGEEYLKAEVKQKGRIRTFVERMARWAMGRESRTVSPAESDLMAALTRLDDDYAGNIELFEQLAREAIERLPPERRDNALKELTQLVEFDIELAEMTQALYDENRNLNRVVKAFIKKATTEPKPRQKIQASADLATWRVAVREGKITPEEAVESFIKEGGDPSLRASLITAFQEDANKTIQAEAIREDAKRAKKEYRNFLREEGRKAAREEDFQKRLAKIAEQASKEASDTLVKETGEETARVEDFQNLVQEAADQAAQEASDALIEEVGEEIARTEDFQKRLEQQAEKAADEAATKEAKRIAKMLTEGLEENLKTESDRLIEEIGKRAAEEEDLAKGVLRERGSRKEGPRNLSLTQVIWQEIENNSEFDVSDHADKVALIKKVLKRRGVADHLLDETAEKAVKAFEEHLLKIAQQAGENLVKQLKRGKVTEAGLFKAIRLNILDPSKTLTESLAALAGWQGLTSKELSELYRITKEARNIKDLQVRLSLLLKQMRIIYAASGLPPDWRDFVSSYTRSSAYSGMGTIFINTTVTLAAPAVNLVRESLKTFLSNPLHPLEALADTTRALVRAYGAAGKRGGLALRTNATLGLSAARATGGKTEASDVGVLGIDALERRMDLALKRIADSSLPKWRKAWESFMIISSFTGKILWRVIGSIDTVSTAQISEFLTEMRLNRNLRRQGLDPVTEWSAFMEAHEAGVRHAVSRLALTPQQATIEMMYRLQDAYYAELQNKTDVNPYEYQLDSRREALTMIGNHAERQGVISTVGNYLADGFGHRNFLGLGFVISGAPIRTIANIAEYTTWYAPGIGLGKLLLEYRSRKASESGIGNYHLHAGSNWQFRRRMYESIFGQVLTGGLIALLAAQPDDDEEKWFGISTSYPWRPGEAVKFRNNQETPFTIYMGTKKEGGRKYLQFTRGVLEMLTFPSVVAKNFDEARRGKEPWLASGAYTVRDMVTVGWPVIDSLAKQYNTFTQGNEDRILENLLRKGSVLLPASSLTRSIQKLTTEVPAKNSSNYLASILVPGYAIFKDDGDLELRNALDEPIYADNSIWGKLNKMGLPFGFLPTSAPQDELLAKDFAEMNYPVPPAPAFKAFETQIEGREQELLERNGVEDVTALYSLRLQKRAEAFKRIYREDPDPGDSAKDDRSHTERLKDGDKKAYAERMANLWSMATKEANEELGITEDE